MDCPPATATNAVSAELVVLPVSATTLNDRRHLPHCDLLEHRRWRGVVATTLARVQDIVHDHVGRKDAKAQAKAREGPLVEPRDHRVSPPRVLPTKSAHPDQRLPKPVRQEG